MSVVLPFTRNRRMPAWDRADAWWFAKHPGRRFRLRRATDTEVRQAECHHGRVGPAKTWTVAVQRVPPCFFARRFVVGSFSEAGEAFARETFDRAPIAGEPPRHHSPDQRGRVA